jgi:hypothetical protein
MLFKKFGPLLVFPSTEKATTTGRPSLRTPETVTKICAAIREDGHTDTHAAALAGVSSSTVARWREEDEEFAGQLVTARAEYLDARMKEIRGTRKRDGSIDWRAQAWLMQAVAPEVYGTPSRRYSLAREKEEKERAAEKARADEEVISPADLARCQQWRAYSLEKMNGAGEEEARWRGHFLHHSPRPVFPGSLAIAGAEIPEPPELSPEEQALLASLRERRRVAMAAIEAYAPLGERQGREATADEATDGGSSDASESGSPRAELQNATKLPETRAEALGAAHDSPHPIPDSQNTTILPETRGAAAPGEETRGGDAPTPWVGATPVGGAAVPTEQNCQRDADTPHGAPDGARGGGAPASNGAFDHAAAVASSNDYLAWLVADYRARNPESVAAVAAERNGANLPESAAERSGRAAGDGRLADREIGIPKPAAGTRRPLTGAARAAAEAKEWRRINRLVEEEFERSADRAMAVAESASRDAIPGMWAGF